MIIVVRAGPLTTVQDLGRPGFAHLGVPRSGALDAPALALANRLVGNPAGAAGLETTLLGCAVRCTAAATVAVTGAPAPVTVDGEPVPFGAGFVVPAGVTIEVRRASAGVRSYLAVGGGIDVEPVLGSRSTDTLSGLGPPRLADGMSLPVGAVFPGPGAAGDGFQHEPRAGGSAVGGLDVPQTGALAGDGTPVSLMSGGDLVLRMRLGPRDDWVVGVAEVFGVGYSVSPVSNRVGVRLGGPRLSRARSGELPSEGVVLGAVQVPADGQPLIFLADHPTTGGYPVIGVVDDVTPLAQARPGTTVTFVEALDGSER
jgi:biotin-dependent carboxylase-like uncharacterized protein